MGILVGHGGRPDGSIRSGYPIPRFCKDGREIEILARRFTEIMGLATKVTITFWKRGDVTTFCAVAASLERNLQIIAGDGFFFWFK